MVCTPSQSFKINNAMIKDKRMTWKFCLCCGLFIWFVVNLLQGIFTEIQEDEAYYALYGEHLAWGYYDHPPMVGLMTFLSSIFFSGTLGVRFFTIITSCLSLFVIWLIAIDQHNDKAEVVEPVETPTSLERPFDKLRDLNPKSISLFFIIACSVVMFNIYGFVTTPDATLILFSALFLFVYQRYLNNNSWKNALLMGVMMALMIYSKYHAFLLLGLIVLSNIKLLKDGKFWAACLVALALLMPHILWQIHADFPSFRYHLSGRSESFRWSYFWEYLPNQLLVFNPFTFGAVVYILIKHKPKGWIASSCLLAMTAKAKDDVIASEAKQSREKAPNEVFERGLCFILIGFFFFFWLMAFRGHVEPHWTIVCVIPAVVLVYRKVLSDEKLRRYVKFVILPSLLLIVVLRILILTPLADRFGYHGKKNYYTAIETLAGDHPVVFQGSFQEPALYHYFTGKESAAFRSFYDRKTQYDLWQFDKDWIGQQVFVCTPYHKLSKEYQINGVEFKGFLAEFFQSANRLETSFCITNASSDQTPVFHHGDTLHIEFSIHNPYDQAVVFHHPEFDLCIKAHYLPGDGFSYCQYDDNIFIPAHETYHGHLVTVVSENVKEGKKHFALGIGDGIGSFVTEGSQTKIIVE